MFVASGYPGTLLYEGRPPLNLHYRPLRSSDYEALKAIHRDLFPIDYEEVFFRKAVGSEDRVFSWAAVHNQYGVEHLVGFVTARVVYLYECDPVDRNALGLASHALDGHCCVYVLTLGVVPSCRQCGVARALLGLVAQHAARLRCRAIFLHVISYNEAAMRLYGNAGYQPMARLPNFYHLVTGRQPNPDQAWYDAFLYATFLPSSGPEPSPAMQWAGGVLGAAVAPLRSVLGSFNGCMPAWLCRQSYGAFLPFAGPPLPRTSSKGSLADTATSCWGPPGAPAPPPAVPPVPPPPPTAARCQGDPSVSSCCDSSPGYPPPGYGQGPGPGVRYEEEGSCWGPMPGGAAGGTAAQAIAGCRYHPDGRGLSSGSGGGRSCAVTEGGGDPAVRSAGAAPLYRPPSPPPVPPGWPPSHSSLQHRHAHGSSGGAGAHHAPQHGHGNGHAPHQHYSRPPRHSSSGGSGGSGGSGCSCGGSGGHGHCGGHSQGQRRGALQAQRRSGEQNGAQWAPHGLAGGGLRQQQHQQMQQQQQQQQQQAQHWQHWQQGSLLTSLFRPPGASPHPCSR